LWLVVVGVMEESFSLHEGPTFLYRL
jgi:hypothetical protein